METLEQCQWCCSIVFIVDFEHTSNFGLNVEFDQTKVWWVHMEKINTFNVNKIY